MSTSEAQIAARAFFDSLINASSSALQSTAAWVAANPSSQPQRIDDLLSADAPPQLRNLVSVFAREGKLHLIPAVAQEFKRYTSGMNEQPISSDVTSAVELDAAQREKVAAELHATYGERLDLTYTVDPSIIGGLIIRVGDRVLDNSLRTRLSAVQRSMLSS